MKIERFVPARDASTAAQPEEKQGAGGAGLRFRNGLLAAFGQGYVVILGIYYKLQTFLYLPVKDAFKQAVQISVSLRLGGEKFFVQLDM